MGIIFIVEQSDKGNQRDGGVYECQRVYEFYVGTRGRIISGDTQTAKSLQMRFLCDIKRGVLWWIFVTLDK